MNKKALLSTILVVIAATAGGFLISKKPVKIIENINIEPEIEAQVIMPKPKIEADSPSKEQSAEKATDVTAQQTENSKKTVNLDEIVEQLDEIAEQVELLTIETQKFLTERESQKTPVILVNKEVKGAKITSTEESRPPPEEPEPELPAEPTAKEEQEPPPEPPTPAAMPESTPEPPTPSYPIFVPAPPPPKLLISEIQIESASSTNDEFVELYNPNPDNVSLAGWSLQKATNTGSVSKKNFTTGDVIPSMDYFLVVNNNANKNLLSLADMTHNSFGITANNTIFLVSNRNKITSGQESSIIDKIGYGEPFSPEATPASSPEDGQTTGRKWTTTTESYLDTDNNYNDFEIQTPTPKTQNQTLTNITTTTDATTTTATTTEATTTICNIQATSSPALYPIIFNEIAWMGTATSSNDEWIELKNVTTSTVNLDDWQILDKDSQIEIIFTASTSIETNSFFLLERTDDDSVPSVPADLTYEGALGNSDEGLYLFNSACQLIDFVEATSSWPAGDNTSKQTMERRVNLTWQTSSESHGTSKAENSSGEATATSTATSTEEIATSTEEISTSTASSSQHIIISEIQIKDASSSSHDFIELFNPTEENIDISGFQIKKRISGGGESSVRKFLEGSIIPAGGYFLWANTAYTDIWGIPPDATTTKKLTRDNSIALFDTDENIIDQVAWGTSTEPFVETMAFSENPAENQSLTRKKDENDDYIDTNDNSQDFEIKSPSPTNSQGQVGSIP